MMEIKEIKCKKECVVRSGLLTVSFNKVSFEENYLHLYRDDAYITCIDLNGTYLKYLKCSSVSLNFYELIKKE